MVYATVFWRQEESSENGYPVASEIILTLENGFPILFALNNDANVVAIELRGRGGFDLKDIYQSLHWSLSKRRFV